MPWGRYPERIGDFQKWATDQTRRGTVAGNKVTSSKRGRKWRLKRRRRRNRNGSKD